MNYLIVHLIFQSLSLFTSKRSSNPPQLPRMTSRCSEALRLVVQEAARHSGWCGGRSAATRRASWLTTGERNGSRCRGEGRSCLGTVLFSSARHRWPRFDATVATWARYPTCPRVRWTSRLVCHLPRSPIFSENLPHRRVVSVCASVQILDPQHTGVLKKNSESSSFCPAQRALLWPRTESPRNEIRLYVTQCAEVRVRCDFPACSVFSPFVEHQNRVTWVRRPLRAFFLLSLRFRWRTEGFQENTRDAGFVLIRQMILRYVSFEVHELCAPCLVTWRPRISTDPTEWPIHDLATRANRSFLGIAR